MRKNNKFLILVIITICVILSGIGVNYYMHRNANKEPQKENESLKIITMEEQLKNIPEDNIYHIDSEYMFAFNPTPERLYKEADIVLIGKFNSNIKTFTVKTRINTTTKFDITKVLKNVTDENFDTSVTFDRSGGLMNLNEYIETSKEDLKEDEFKDVSASARKASYITQSYSPDNILDFDNNTDEYILFLKYVNGKLKPVCEYHGIRKVIEHKIYNYDSKKFEESSIIDK